MSGRALSDLMDVNFIALSSFFIFSSATLVSSSDLLLVIYSAVSSIIGESKILVRILVLGLFN